jgi:uncharacterized membrane protein YwaF
MFYLIFTICIALSIFLSLYITPKSGQKIYLERIIKVSAVVYIVLSMLHFFLPDLFVSPIGDPALEMPLGRVGAILRWLNAICFIVLPIAVFQKNKYFEKIASFVCLPIALVNVGFYSHYMYYFTKVPAPGGGLYTLAFASEEFKALLLDVTFRSFEFGLTCLAQILALVLLTYRNREKLKIVKDEIGNFILIILGVTYLSLPVYVAQFFFGYVNIEMQRFTVPHIIWMIAIPVIIIVLYNIFKSKTYEARYLLVLSMSWALMYQFTQMFSGAAELNVMKLPLQLCNLGSYLALIMLAKKSEKIYHFTIIVNVVGALVAIVILDIVKKDSSLTHFFVIHYIVEHTKVMIIPILCLVLKVFKPLTLKSLKHFSVGYTAYWAFILVLGTLSNGFKRMPEFEKIRSFFTANHLFMFDKDTARGLIGFTDPLFENGVIKLGYFELYPLVQILVYAAFMLICICVFFLIYALTTKQRREYVNELNKK